MKKKLYLGAISLIALINLANADERSSKKLTLSLHEAIALAVRTNPNVQQLHLGFLSQKFNLHVQEWQFQPHYTLQAGMERNRYGISGSSLHTSNTAYVQPGISLLTPFGTTGTLTATNTKTSFYNSGLQLQVLQPLMRGFGHRSR